MNASNQSAKPAPSPSQSKKILLVLGHPSENSLNAAFCRAYRDGAESSGHETRQFQPSQLDYASQVMDKEGAVLPLEKDLRKAQEDITWADHLVIFFPVWGGGMPGFLKSFFDRAFTPGFAFFYAEDKHMPQPLLKGKTARVIVTMDAPTLYYRFTGRAGDRTISDGILKICGIKPVHFRHYGLVKSSSKEKRAKWIDEVRAFGHRGK